MPEFMRRGFWLTGLLIAFLAMGLPTVAQTQTESQGAQLKANPFGLFAGQFQFGAERHISGKRALQLTAGYVRSNLELNTSDLESLLGVSTSLNEVDWQGFVVQPELRQYLSAETGKGMYFGAFARVRCIRRIMTTNFVGTQRRTALGAGLVLGGQFNMTPRLTGDLFIGPQVKSVTTSYGDHFVYGEDDWIPGIRFGMLLGWRL
jgi:hypothetical protein